MSRGIEPILRLVVEGPALLGRSRLVCVDGPSGSGKTTLTERLRHACAEHGLSVAVVHLDDVYEGWSGLPSVGEHIAERVVGPLGLGLPGSFRRWDWHRARRAEEITVPPRDVVVLEGVGSGSPLYADLTTTLVWVHAPEDVRRRRGADRDGPAVAARLGAWAAEEDALLAEQRTRERADVTVDGTSGRTVVRGSGP